MTPQSGPQPGTQSGPQSDPMPNPEPGAAPGARRPTVLAIVLNYDGREMTLATVARLLALDYPRLGILVVDNGSSDGSDAAVGEAFPTVRRLRTAVNLGISGGLNLGFRVGLEEGWDYLMPMNNDIEVAPDLLRASASTATPLVGSSRCRGRYHRSGIAPCPEGSGAMLPLPRTASVRRTPPGGQRSSRWNTGRSAGYSER